VVPPEDAHALAAAIQELFVPDALASAFEGAEAARHALTWDAAAAQHESVYEEIRR
jgi:glycosyltransferase involved in cell wall biosynthesis